MTYFGLKSVVKKVARCNISGSLLWVECISFGANETVWLERISLNLLLHVLVPYDETTIIPCAYQKLDKCTCTHLPTSPTP